MKNKVVRFPFEQIRYRNGLAALYYGIDEKLRQQRLNVEFRLYLKNYLKEMKNDELLNMTRIGNIVRE